MEVWKVAIDLVTEIYQETSSYPENEKYCIVQHFTKFRLFKK